MEASTSAPTAPAAAPPAANGNGIAAAAAPATAPEETQESIYARNRAIYEASIKPKEAQTHAASNGEGNDAKVARPREEDEDATAAEGASPSTSGPPAKKKLIRAGDRVAAAAAPVEGGSPATSAIAMGSAGTGTPEPSSATAPITSGGGVSGSIGESMREKLARANRSGSGTPFVAQPQYSPNAMLQQNQQLPQVAAGMAGSPPPGVMAGQASTSATVEEAIDNNTMAFVSKNPQIDPAFVKQALRHSHGEFNENFHTALNLLIKNSAPRQQPQQQQGQPQPQQQPQRISPVVAQGAFQPSARYPGQQMNPTPPPTQGRYPGQVPNGAVPPRNYPGAMSPPAGALPLQSGQPMLVGGPRSGAGSPPTGQANLINGQSAATLQAQGAGGRPSIPKPERPPPPVLVGTHPAIGFSALQVLPTEQHAQYFALAPQQQTDYSIQVYNSLSDEQKQNFTFQWKQSEALRQQWNMWYQQNPAPPQHGQIMIPPRGTPGVSPYAGYAGHAPTNQQQMQQQRFPGQNPVFRVGGPGQNPAQAPAQAPSQQQPPPQQYQWFSREQSRLLSQMSPEDRQMYHQLPPQDQHNYVVQSVQLKQETAKRMAQQNQRMKQQNVMAATHKAAKSGGAQAAAAPVQAAAGQKKKRKKAHDSDDSDALNLHDDDTDDDRDDDDADGDDGSEAEAEREAQGVIWFNNAKAEELMEMTACSLETANAVIEMRPYLSPGDIRGKFRKRKGVSGNMFDNYVDLMHSYAQTDECLAKCTKIGQELLDIMKIWTGGKKIDPTPSMRPSVEPETAAAAAGEDVKPKAEITLEGEASGTGMTDSGGDIKVEVTTETEIKPQTEADAKPDEEKKPSGDFLTVPGTGEASSAPSPDATTLTAENTSNLGTGMIELSEDVLEASKKQDASEEVKKAFEDYIYTQPKLLAEGFKLKSYQLLGVNWLNMLYRKNISCILADEMGLGKTAQVIALVAHLKEKGVPGPHLVIVPSSTLDNWMREFERFAPTLKVFAYYGNQAERADSRFFLKQQEDLDVIVTTYNMATTAGDDRKFLKKMDFQACIFDEGHQLKNAESKKYKDLMEIKVRWRCLLTGTPLQNNLQELVSLLSFILPKIFSEAQESLRAIFKVPPEAQKNLLTRQRVRAAKQVMTPFVLRRKKAQVLQDLPSKTEIIEYCEMTPTQRDIYRETLAKHKKTVVEYQPSGTNTPVDAPPKKRGRAAAAKTGKPVQENTTSNILMSLRKAANHPMLFRRLYDDKKIRQMAKDCLKEPEFADRNVDYIYEDMEIMTDFELHRLVKPFKILGKYALKHDEWMDAGKVHKLKAMLPEMKARGDRILIFSQFVQVLDILQQVLETMGMKFLVLTGQTHVNDRQALVDEFTEDDSITCFLLSTRAGGLGLNLMAANTVIIMDMDFNPHNDKQAMDRTYRIGQKRDVTIYKFVTKGTIEEDMLALATTKLALDEQVSAESAVSGEMAGNLEIEEGNEGIIEKKVKTSLMSTLQKRFEGGEIEIPDEEVKPEEDKDVKMDGAEDTTDAKDEVKAEDSDLKEAPVAKKAAIAGRRLKLKVTAPEKPKAEVDENGEEVKAEKADAEEDDDDDALSSVGSDGSVYEEKDR